MLCVWWRYCDRCETCIWCCCETSVFDDDIVMWQVFDNDVMWHVRDRCLMMMSCDRCLMMMSCDRCLMMMSCDRCETGVWAVDGVGAGGAGVALLHQLWTSLQGAGPSQSHLRAIYPLQWQLDTRHQSPQFPTNRWSVSIVSTEKRPSCRCGRIHTGRSFLNDICYDIYSHTFDSCSSYKFTESFFCLSMTHFLKNVMEAVLLFWDVVGYSLNVWHMKCKLRRTHAHKHTTYAHIHPTILSTQQSHIQPHS